MTRNEVLDFVRRNTFSFMATVENGEPRVRGMDTPVIDDNGLTFCTGSNKAVCAQLTADPSVELCYWSIEDGTQIRLRGRMEKLDDEALKKSIVETRFTFLKPVVEKYGWGSLTLFRLSRAAGSCWRMANTAGGCEPFDF
jgi:uncharacterized pyridoxamine 5'-phosphate oxidase family protein